MKKLNIIFIIYMIVGLFYIAFGINEHGFQSLILATSGWITCWVSILGYVLNGGK